MALARTPSLGTDRLSILVAIAGLGIFFSGLLRFDCRHIDGRCNPQSSWHANAHVANAAFIALALVLAPFVLARALKFVPEWRDLWIPTLAFGIGTVVAAVVGGAIGAGAAALLGVLPWFSWITILAARRTLAQSRGAATDCPHGLIAGTEQTLLRRILLAAVVIATAFAVARPCDGL